MTIKEAFEALGNACAKGMKNPFFVMKRLKEAFADVADKVVDAGGSIVSVTPITDSGTKIATVTVDGEDTDLYAPENNTAYSTTEKKIGKWADGSDLYQLTMEQTTENGGGYQNIYKIPDGVNVKEINASYESNSGEVITGAWVNGNILYECAIANTAGTNPEKYLMVRRITSDAGWATVKFVCTLKYTKTTL